MNMLVAPESRRVDVEMDVRDVREVSSTWTLREWGETGHRSQVGEPQVVAEVLTPASFWVCLCSLVFLT